MLKLLTIAFDHWNNVNLDFVIDLFINYGYNIISIVVNYLTKKTIIYHAIQIKTVLLLKRYSIIISKYFETLWPFIIPYFK